MAKVAPTKPLPEEALAIPADVRERVRLAVSALERRKKALTYDAVSSQAGCRREVAGVLLRLYRDGHLPPAGTPKRNVGAWGEVKAASTEADAESVNARAHLATLVAGIRSHADREQALLELGRCVLLGVVDDKEAREVRAALAETRHNDKHAREAPDEQTAQTLLAGPEAYALLRAFEGIVSDERRDRILGLVASEFAADLSEHPDVDVGAAEATPE